MPQKCRNCGTLYKAFVNQISSENLLYLFTIFCTCSYKEVGKVLEVILTDTQFHIEVSENPTFRTEKIILQQEGLI